MINLKKLMLKQIIFLDNMGFFFGQHWITWAKKRKRDRRIWAEPNSSSSPVVDKL